MNGELTWIKNVVDGSVLVVLAAVLWFVYKGLEKRQEKEHERAIMEHAFLEKTVSRQQEQAERATTALQEITRDFAKSNAQLAITMQQVENSLTTHSASAQAHAQATVEEHKELIGTLAALCENLKLKT